MNQGECLRVALRNALDADEPASFHLHGAALYVTATGAPAPAANPDATVSPGASVIYEWWVSEHEPEGTHYCQQAGAVPRRCPGRRSSSRPSPSRSPCWEAPRG